MLKRLLLSLIKVYQGAVSPLLPKSCRFEPTCSAYAADAIRLHGPFRGTLLTARRLGRCHPWGGSGFDPVPDPASSSSSRDDGSD